MPRQTTIAVVITLVAGAGASLAAFGPPATAGGTIKSVSAEKGELTVVVGSGQTAKEHTLRVTATSQILFDGKPARLSDFADGTKVTVTYDKDSNEVVRLRAVPPKPESQSGDATEAATTEAVEAPKSRAEATRSASARRRAGGKAAAVGEWPQWRGPDRNGVSREAGLLKSWPSGGPQLAWKATGLGGGYSTPSIAGGRIYGMGYRGSAEVVWAYDVNTGKEVWSTKIANANRGVGYNEGSRCSPTIVGNRLYALGVGGDLVCLDTNGGKLVWHKSVVRDFGGGVPGWGYSESPLVDGDKVLATPGGGAATIVALNKDNGELIWKSSVPQGNGAQYSSIIAADAGGQRQYVQFLNGGVVGVAANDGRFLWSYSKPANGTANCSTPIFHDNCVFAASAYGTGGGLIRLAVRGNAVTASEVYFTRQMQNHHGGMVLVDGHLYGFDNDILTCLDFASGRVMWQNRSVGKGSLVFADGCLYARSEGGPLALVEATPSGYAEKGRFQQPDRSGANAWSHPVVAGGRLYVRDQDMLLCYDVRATR